MRIRIRQPLRGEIDGVPLENFQVGSIYDVPSSVATYLITTGWAEFVPGDHVSAARPPDRITTRAIRN